MKTNIKEINGKVSLIKSCSFKLLMLIILGVGVSNVFADQTTTNTTNYKIGVTNSTAWYLALQCFPSNVSASISPTHTAYCDTGDTDVYFGRFSAGSMTQDELNSIVVRDIDAQLENCTNYHYMQNNHAWHIHEVSLATNDVNKFTKVYMQISGDPEYTIDGCWNNDQ
jgi:hypothetical protein